MSITECQVLVDLSAFRPDRTGGAQRFVYELFARLSRTTLTLNFAIGAGASEWMSTVPGLRPDAVTVLEAAGSGFLNFTAA